MMMANEPAFQDNAIYLINVSGEIKLIRKDIEEGPSLEEAYSLIGTDIVQMLNIGNYQMLVDEEGKFKKHLMVNPAASTMYRACMGGSDIVGNVLILTGKAKWR